MLIDRVNKLKQELISQQLDALIISDVYHIAYLTGYDNFSVEEREAFLIITKDQQYVITDGRYTTAIKEEVKHFELLERGYQNSLGSLLIGLKEKHQIQVLGAQFDNLSYLEYQKIKKVFKKIKQAEIHAIRSIKTQSEITFIQKACDIGDKAFDYILTEIKSGISEKEVALKLELFIKKHGGTLSFDTIIGFGPNSAIPHHQTGEGVLKNNDGQFVLMDFGVKLHGYCSDMTRTVFLDNPSKKQQEIYDTVYQAQQAAVEYIQKMLTQGKQLKAKDVDASAREYILSKGYPSIPHSLGHGIGLQVHEPPYLSGNSNNILQEGMVFSIEPGIYIPGFGGVRIEDLYVIEGNVIKNLTQSPKELTMLD